MHPDIGSLLDDSRAFFLTNGNDHHALVIAHSSARAFDDEPGPEDVTLNQITWQVGSLRETVDAAEYFRVHSIAVRREGRDMPGSNWHTYFQDPDGHMVELYYGMEQIGWNLLSKPFAMHCRAFLESPALPQINEAQELRNAQRDGIDISSGYAVHDPADDDTAGYDVGGVLLPRPFKIVKIGPICLFVNDVEVTARFYVDHMGFHLTEETEVAGHCCKFLRNQTEHHSLGLFPKSLRTTLGRNVKTSAASVGMQLGSYQQLCEAIAYLEGKGVKVNRAPEYGLLPGIDYAVEIFDPAGHAVILYYYMETIGWDGKPRPAELRRVIREDEWPEAIEPLSDTFMDTAFQGPLG